MSVPIIYLTRATLALAEDNAMLFVGSPSGPMNDGSVSSVEAARLIFSHRVLREMAKMLNQHVAALDQLEAANAAKAVDKAERSIDPPAPEPALMVRLQ